MMEIFVLFAVVFLVALAVGYLLALTGAPVWLVTAAQVAAGVVTGALL